MRRPRGVQVQVTADELEQWRRSHQAVERTTGMLRVYQRGGQATVAVEDVLDLLGQEPATVEAPRAAARDPREDPLTGIMWAGPPGSAPPGR